MKKLLLLFVGLLCLSITAPNLHAQGTPPPTPANLTAKLDIGPSPGVALEWQAPMGMWEFKVYRSLDDTSHFQPLGYAGTNRFLDHDVSAGNHYYYYVTSISLRMPATVVESPRSNIADIIVSVPPGRATGTISGTVVDSVTGKPIPLVHILFFPISKPILWIPQTVTDTGGHYKAVLDTATYLIYAQPQPIGMSMLMRMSILPDYLPEWYKDARDPKHATPVLLAKDAQFVANFDLEKPIPPTFVSISGTVTDTLGHALKGATVAIMRTMQDMDFASATMGMMPGLGDDPAEIEGLGHACGVVWIGKSDSLGHYKASVIANRPYIALASKAGYVPEYYNNKPNPMKADIIVPTRDTTGIDFSLAPRSIVLTSSISGIVRDTNLVRVPSRIVLLPVRPTPWQREVRYGHTDSLGAYKIDNVRDGKYFVLALPFGKYAPAFYSAGGCGVLRIKDADTVVISGNTTGIDICVKAIKSSGFAHISGRVQSTGGAALDGVRVTALSDQGDVVGIGMSDATGNYAMDNISAGTVSVVVDREEYNGAQTNVSIAAGASTVGNVDFALSPLTPTSVGAQPTAPVSYNLRQNYPNPFNPSTTISFALPRASSVSLTVFNLLGQEVATLVNGELPAGTREIVWNGRDNAGRSLASGLYFYRLKATPVGGGTEYSQMRKMILLK
jgi:hypothetical protein